MKKKIDENVNINHRYMIELIMFVFLLTGCSYVGRRNKDVQAGQDGSVKLSGKMIPQEKYDELLRKYDDLKNKQEAGGGERISEGLINELSFSPKAELAETIDVFAQQSQNEITKTLSNSPILINDPSLVVSDQEIEEQFTKLKKAEQLIEANKFDEALAYIKRDTEQSSILQIRLKAKFLLGELLLRQNEYDLAMQMFEEIINQYAFSGLVIKTLGKLIHCCDKLKLEDKKTKYFSMLNDIFGTG